MINEFEFEYFVPTPDTTANCALSRWNDSLFSLSEFIKNYMTSQQDVCFGFNRPLNISELIRLKTGNTQGVLKHLLDYQKYGDLKAKICGFDVPLLNKEQPFLFLNWYYDKNENKFINALSVNRVAHVINKNSSYNSITRKSKFIEALNAIIYDITNEYSDDKVKYYFGESSTKPLAITALNNVITELNSLTNYQSNFIFGFNDKEDFDNNVINNGYTQCNYSADSYTTYMDENLFTDIAWVSDSVESFETPVSPELPFVLENIQPIIEEYFNSRGLNVIFQKTINPAISYINCYGDVEGHIFICFRFLLKESPVPSKFLSHDGSYIPLSKQVVSIKPSLVPTTICTGNGSSLPIKIMWDLDEEKPIYIDENGDSKFLSLEIQKNNIGGIDYTIWSTPVQKTSNGYKFECILPLAFYNIESDSYNNEYYSTKTGDVLYRVPVFRKLRQNAEDVLFDEQKTRALNNISCVDDNNYNNDANVVLGGAVVDDFTNKLYTVVDKQEIASKTEYGEVKIQPITESVMTQLLNYSYGSSWSLPTSGRAVDGIGVMDILNNIVNDNLSSNCNFIVSSNRLSGFNNGDVSLLTDTFVLYSKNGQINLASSGTISIGSQDNVLYNEQNSTLYLNCLVESENIEPHETNLYSLGSKTKKWDNAYISHYNPLEHPEGGERFSSDVIFLSGNTVNTDSGSLKINAEYEYYFDQEHARYTSTPISSIITYSSVVNNLMGVPVTDLYIQFQNDVNGISNLIVGSTNNQQNAYLSIGISTGINGSLYVNGDVNITNGFIPSLIPESNDMPVGSIAIVYIYNNTQTPFSLFNAGTELTIGNGTDGTYKINIFLAKGNQNDATHSFGVGTMIASSNINSDYGKKFKLLSEVSAQTDTAKGMLAFVMRTA